ncbi:MAG: DNA-binding response regulator, partial [Microcystis panniformis]
MGKWGDSTKNPNTPTPDTIFFTFMKILIVDDEKELTEPLEQILAQEGYEVDIADNGRTGLE